MAGMSQSCGHNPSSKKSIPMNHDLEQWLEKAQGESKMYLFIEALPSYDTLRTMLTEAQSSGYDFNALSAQHLFYVAQILPDLTTSLDKDKLTEGYIAAIRYLPITWWGMPDNLNTDASKQLLTTDLNTGLFLDAIHDQTALRGSESEDNTLAKQLEWKAGDYIFAFFATKNEVKYDLYDSPAKREKAKEKLIRQLKN